MKFRMLLTLLLCVGLAGFAFAQEDIIVIPGGLENAGLMEATINGDTLDGGVRANPDRIYELEAGQFYIQNTPISINNEGGTLTIRGQEGGTKPIIMRMEVDDVAPGANSIKGSLTMQNVHYQAMTPANNLPWSNFNLSGDNSHLHVEGCFLEFCNGIIFNLNSVLQGAEITVKNSYFRDLFSASQWWAHRVVQCKVPVDKFIFENNTVTGGGLTVLGQECLFEYAVINHNTFINNHKYPFLNQYWKEVYFTNNLFVNANMVGEDTVNVATGGQDPDALLMGIMGVDTIETSIAIQGKFLNADSTELTQDVDEISDYIYYAADNVVTYSSVLDNYYNGGYNDIGDYPVSYLTWSGIEGPHAILNVPGIWYNERSTQMIADWANLVDENNHIYDMTLAELGLGTDPLSAAAAEVFVQWNQNAWGVPDIAKPTTDEFAAAGYYIGDYDPNTIPGLETENGAGITVFTDFIEDFSYSADLTSQSDGFSIGALHWTDEINTFDSDVSLASIKAAYNAATGVEDMARSVDFSLKQNYPNPFNPTTNIQFKLAENSKVKLTVFNQMGQVVATLVDGVKHAGSYDITWDASSVATGIYFYTLEADGMKMTKKMMLIK